MPGIKNGQLYFVVNEVILKGEGKGPHAAALTPHPVDFAQPLKDWPNTKGDPVRIFEVITKGISNSAMVGFPQFSENERWGLVYRVTEFSAPPQKKAKYKF